MLQNGLRKANTDAKRLCFAVDLDQEASQEALQLELKTQAQHFASTAMPLYAEVVISDPGSVCFQPCSIVLALLFADLWTFGCFKCSVHTF